MKILYHHRTLSKDGQAVHIEELIAAFRRAGHLVEVVGPQSHAKADFGSDGGKLSRLRAALPRAFAEVLEFAYSFLAFIRLWQAYRRFQPDFLYERYNLFLLAGAWLHKLTGVPFALEVNAPLVLERSREPGLSLKRFATWCEQAAWRAADVVLPVTEVLADHVTAAGVPRHRIRVLHNGIAVEHFPPTLTGDTVRARHGLTGKTVVGFTGFVRAWHGLPAVIDVLAATQQAFDVHFLIVGDGPPVADVLDAARRAGVADRLTVTGIVPRADIPAHIAAFDIALQPKATAYASPLKLFEYMILGRAVVAPDQPNLREILSHDDNALLFDPANPDEFKRALTQLIADPGLRDRLGAAARATILARNLTWDGNAAQIVGAFERPTSVSQRKIEPKSLKGLGLRP